MGPSKWDCGSATTVAMRPVSLCGRRRHATDRRHGTAVPTGPPSLFIFRALSAMMQAENEREEDAATLVGILKTGIGLGRSS
jgi:hypothetical protein